MQFDVAQFAGTQPFAKRLGAILDEAGLDQKIGKVRAGRGVTAVTQDLLYGPRAEEVQSSALLSLPSVGLVAIGSRDPNRFFPGMGTLFLRMMGESFAAAMARFGGRGGAH